MLRIGLIGAGKMATALVRGFLKAELTSAENIVASDTFAPAREHFSAETGARAVLGNPEVLNGSDIIFLAVKPQVMAEVLHELQPLLEARHLVISIAAGTTLKTLSDVLGSNRRLFRVMPNTPCLVGEAASGYSRGGTATDEDAALVLQLLSAVGLAIEVPERLLDAVTGLSGSGPAYVCLMIEAMSDGGVRMGLPREVATRLAAQTLLGAAKMVLETGTHPGVLKDGVTSPGGTTIAGLHALERGGLRAALMNAVEEATHRATELGKKP